MEKKEIRYKFTRDKGAAEADAGAVEADAGAVARAVGADQGLWGLMWGGGAVGLWPKAYSST